MTIAYILIRKTRGAIPYGQLADIPWITEFAALEDTPLKYNVLVKFDAPNKAEISNIVIPKLEKIKGVEEVMPLYVGKYREVCDPAP